jgi:hypothetical protein
MNRTHALAFSSVVFALSVAVRGGDLNPPVGPVAETHKTLTEVEPRRPIGQENVPFVISAPGSYYLTGPLEPTAAGQTAVTIASSEVTLDLSGFSIRNSPVFAFTTGVLVSGTRSSIAVSNGVVRGTTTNGINTSAAVDAALTDLRVNSCGNNGFLTGPSTILTRCTSSNNFFDGFETGANNSLSDCSAFSNDGVGCDLGLSNSARGCTASANLGRGFDAGNRSTLTACTADGNGGIGILTGTGCVVADSTAAGNGAEAGMFLGNASTARNCTSQGNSGGGFDSSSAGLSSFTNCTALSNGSFGFNLSDSSTATGCTASFNTTDGFVASADAVMTDCTATFDDGEGFAVGSTCTLSGCTASNNASFGFDVGEACELSRCIARNNGSSGFNLGTSSRASDCMARDNDGDGFFTAENCSLTDCTAHSNDGGVQTGDGFTLAEGSSTVGCTATANADVGFESFGRNLIVGCVSKDNLSFGMRISNNGSRVDSCLMRGNGTFDLRVDGANNQIIRNRWSTFTTAIFNAVGDIQNATDNSNFHLDQAWANFDF